MIQPKYISILKMALIQAFALILLLELQESIWRLIFIDCLEIFQKTLYSEGEASFLDFPECYDKDGVHLFHLKLQPNNILIIFFSLFFSHIILSIISTIRIGYKWYWAFLSIVFNIIKNILYSSADDSPGLLQFSAIYRGLLKLSRNITFTVYLDIIILITSALFLYFGKPVINFIKGKPTSSDDAIDNILDDNMV